MAIDTGWHAVGTAVGTSWCRPARAGGHAVRTARLWRAIVAFTHLAREGRMTVTIGRRELLAALGGAAAAWPLAARGQQPKKLPTIGFLGADATVWSSWTAAFVARLRELGWIEGRTV